MFPIHISFPFLFLALGIKTQKIRVHAVELHRSGISGSYIVGGIAIFKSPCLVYIPPRESPRRRGRGAHTLPRQRWYAAQRFFSRFTRPVGTAGDAPLAALDRAHLDPWSSYRSAPHPARGSALCMPSKLFAALIPMRCGANRGRHPSALGTSFPASLTCCPLQLTSVSHPTLPFAVLGRAMQSGLPRGVRQDEDSQ